MKHSYKLLTLSTIAIVAGLAPQTANANTHTVKTGDTLYSLANKYHTSVEEIQNLNHLTGSDINVGQSLELPQVEAEENEQDQVQEVSESSISPEEGVEAEVAAESELKEQEESTQAPAEVSSDTVTQQEVVTEEAREVPDFVVNEEPGRRSGFLGDNTYYQTLEEAERRANEAFDYREHKNWFVDWTDKGYVVYLQPKVQEPVVDSTQPTTSPAIEPSYTVKAGDSLWRISQAHGVSVADLKAWNGMTSDRIYPGNQLKVRRPQQENQAGEISGPGVSGQGAKTHTVRAGDSLWKISRDYGITVAQLREWNRGATDMIHPGDKLVVKPNQQATSSTPATSNSSTGSAKTHIVRAGDSLWKISRDYGVTVAQLREWNRGATDMIHPGDKLVVQPNQQSTTPTPAPATPSTGSAKTHTVRAGDSLWKISRDYGVTVADLKAWNNKSNDRLQIGDQLIVKRGPATTTTTPTSNQTVDRSYVVKPGDSYWKIAQSLGVSVNQLKGWNNATNNFLQVGDRLVVRAQARTNQEVPAGHYQVKNGDYLYRIANQHHTTVNRLKTLNNLTGNLIHPGDILRVR